MRISKTLVVNAATVGVGLYAVLENSSLLANNPWLLAALGAVNIGLRCVTASPLFAPPAAPPAPPEPIVVNLNISKEQVKEVINA
jgi:hypothetical protein